MRPLYKSHLYVLKADFVFPKGSKTLAGKELKSDIKIERGAIFVPHWKNFGKFEAERRYHIFKNGLYEAIRGIAHVLFGYGIRGGEGGELKLMQKIAHRLINDICALMNKSSKRDQLTQIQQDLSELADGLKNSINEAKKEAKEKIAKASTLKIQRGGKEITNIPATIWRLVAAETRIQKRMDEILTIAPRLVSFEQTLSSELTRVWSVLEWLRSIIAQEFKRMKYSFSFSEKIIFNYRCDRAIERLKTIDDIAPFCRTVELILKDLQIAKEKIEMDQPAARKAFYRILSAIRFKDAQMIFEREILLPFTIWQELGTLSPTRVKNLANKIEKFMHKVDRKLDEADFISPPKKAVLQNLQTVLRELHRPVPNFILVKSAMKRASNLL